MVCGDGQDSEDLEAYPGYIVINAPKLKVHAITCFTNVTRNLRTRPYAMQAGVEAESQNGSSVIIEEI